MTKTLTASCNCGQSALELTGEPIMTTACYCTSCQAGGAIMESLTNAPRLLDKDGGTHCMEYRKDRVRCVNGSEHLREFRLKPDSATRRVVATCCNAPMFLDFEKGHWLSVYKDRLPPEDQPALQMRTMMMDAREGVEFNDDIPSLKKHNGRFMWNLVKAWAAMKFKTPKIDYVKETLDV